MKNILNNSKIGDVFQCKNEKILKLSYIFKDVQNDYASRFMFSIIHFDGNLHYNENGILNTGKSEWKIINKLDKKKYPEYFL